MAYNGWTNRVTWNVNLWIMNDEGLYNSWVEFSRNIEYWNESYVKYFVKSYMEGGTPDMESAKEYDNVNWQEIAESWNSDILEYVISRQR
jgi:hypothetical protein